MKYHLITIAFGIGAVVLFVLGLGTGATSLFIVAALLEVTFWIRKRKRTAP